MIFPLRCVTLGLIQSVLVVGVAAAQNVATPPLPVSKPNTDLVNDLEQLPAETIRVTDPYIKQAMDKWSAEIEALEALDRQETDPADAILFVGSSSIRLWKNVASDMAPYRTIRRGYGGAKYSDLAVFAERLLTPHRYRGVVMFVGNDVSGAADDHTPDEVEVLVRDILRVSRRHQPEAPVLIVEVTPTPTRFDAWPKIRQLNARLREIALTEPNTYFVATADHYLDADNRPIAAYFGEDQLHQNETGYSVWASLIRRRLDEVFRMPGATQ